eukprot:5918080-Prymnesium_polylepis.1
MTARISPLRGGSGTLRGIGESGKRKNIPVEGEQLGRAHRRGEQSAPEDALCESRSVPRGRRSDTYWYFFGASNPIPSIRFTRGVFTPAYRRKRLQNALQVIHVPPARCIGNPRPRVSNAARERGGGRMPAVRADSAPRLGA